MGRVTRVGHEPRLLALERVFPSAPNEHEILKPIACRPKMTLAVRNHAVERRNGGLLHEVRDRAATVLLLIGAHHGAPFQRELSRKPVVHERMVGGVCRKDLLRACGVPPESLGDLPEMHDAAEFPIALGGVGQGRWPYDLHELAVQDASERRTQGILSARPTVGRPYGAALRVRHGLLQHVEAIGFGGRWRRTFEKASEERNYGPDGCAENRSYASEEGAYTCANRSASFHLKRHARDLFSNFRHGHVLKRPDPRRGNALGISRDVKRLENARLVLATRDGVAHRAVRAFVRARRAGKIE